MKRDAINFENEKIPVLFRKILIPTLLGTISMSAVTAIDGIFVGHGAGAEGVAAVNIIAPIFMIMSGIGLMVGSGCSVVASIHLSKQKNKVARLNITQALVWSSIGTALLCALSLISPEQTARLLGASDTLMPQVVGYLKWIMPSFMFQMWSTTGLFIIRLDGSPRCAMWCNITPALLNGVLDWLFIFPLGMGVVGAAIATAISYLVGGIMALTYLLFFASSLRLIPLKMSRKSMLLSLKNMGYQCKIGSSALFGEMTLAVLILVGNLVFMTYLGDAGVGAYGIVCYYAPFFFMVGNAIAQSAQPIISYNYGLARTKEMQEARKLLLATSIIIGMFVASLFITVPDFLVALFVDPHTESGQLAIQGFPYFATGIVFFILNVAITGYYQSVERIKRATLFVFLRGFVLLIPCFFLLPQLLGVKGIWLAMPLAEFTTTLLIIILYSSYMQKIKRMLAGSR